MPFAKLGTTAKQVAEKFVSEVLERMGADAKPPCRGGNKELWTVEVKSALHKMGRSQGYDAYPWLLDFIWWCKATERLILAAESEMDGNIASIADDFQKLPVFKCPVKLLVFSADTDATKKMAEEYLQLFAQHVKDEEYLLVGFTDSGPRCHYFRVPRDGKLEEKVQFEELKIAKSAAKAA